MRIIVNLDVMLARRKMSLTELSSKVGVSMTNLSIFKKSRGKAVRFSTLAAICKALDCQPGQHHLIMLTNKNTIHEEVAL